MTIPNKQTDAYISDLLLPRLVSCACVCVCVETTIIKPPDIFATIKTLIRDRGGCLNFVNKPLVPGNPHDSWCQLMWDLSIPNKTKKKKKKNIHTHAYTCIRGIMHTHGGTYDSQPRASENSVDYSPPSTLFVARDPEWPRRYGNLVLINVGNAKEDEKGKRLLESALRERTLNSNSSNNSQN